jgi:hypothetical protein
VLVDVVVVVRAEMSRFLVSTRSCGEWTGRSVIDPARRDLTWGKKKKGTSRVPREKEFSRVEMS